MNEPKFLNKPNNHIQVRHQSEGDIVSYDYFISRSIAVVGVVFATVNGCSYVLVVKRSNKMRDEANKFGVPCGYLDWDENCWEAMIREVYEETSLYLPDYEKYIVYNNDKKPFEIKDNPHTDKHQNVSLLYVTFLDFMDDGDNFPKHIESYKSKETAEVMWMKVIDFYLEFSNKYQWSFNHNDTIKSAIKFNIKNLKRK